jgi:hypothetical protein
MKQMVYRRLASWSDALDLQSLIHAEGIFCDLTKEAGDGQNFTLVIHRDDYINVELLLAKHNKADINRLPPDYYLFAFSKNELIEIIQNPGDWGEIDYILSVKLLQDRGIQYTKQTLQAFKDKYWSNKREKEKDEIKKQDEAFINSRRFGRSLPEKLLFSFIDYDTSKMDRKFDIGKYITFILMLIITIIWLIFKEYRNFN